MREIQKPSTICGAIILLSFLISNYPSVYLHELAHVTALNILFEDVNPSIHIKGYFLGGHTEKGGDGNVLSSVGQLLGRNYSNAAVHIAGPLVNLALGILGISGATLVKNSYLALGIGAFGLFNTIHLGEYTYKDLVIQRMPNGDLSHFSKESGVSPNVILAVTSLISLLGTFIGAATMYKKTATILNPI